MAPQDSAVIADQQSQGQTDGIGDNQVAAGDLENLVAPDGQDSSGTVAPVGLDMETLAQEREELRAENARIAEELERERKGHSQTKSSMDRHVRELEENQRAVAARLQQLEPLAEEAKTNAWNSLTDAQQRDVAIQEVAALRRYIAGQQHATSNMLVMTARQQELAKKADAVGLDPANLDLSSEPDFWEKYGDAKAEKARKEVEGSMSEKLTVLEKQLEGLRQKLVPSPDTGGIALAGKNNLSPKEKIALGLKALG